jgi:hypothetical protein
MSFCSETRLSASVEPTCPAPRMTIFKGLRLQRGDALR